MPKLRKNNNDDTSQQSQSFSKYISFEQKQTQIPQPIHNFNSQVPNTQQNSPPAKKRNPSSKKLNKSKKKQSDYMDNEHTPTEKLSKRKSKSKNNLAITQSQNLTNLQKQNQNDLNSLSVKIEKPIPKRQKSRRKSIRNVKKTNPNDQDPEKDSPKDFKNNQLRQKNLQIDQKFDENTLENETSNKNEQSFSQVNFNRRLKKKCDQQQMQAIFSRYAEEQISIDFGNKFRSHDESHKKSSENFESDLRDFDLLVKKKEKKPKKEKQVKIKNKYFSNLSLQPSSMEETTFECEEPPQASEELIIERKQLRKTGQNLNRMIEKRVNHLKDRREFKNSENDLKFMNHIKSKLEQVKNVEQVQVDIEMPNLFTKKAASAALYMKNTIDKEDKFKASQESSSLLTDNDKKESNTNDYLNKSQHQILKDQTKRQEFQLQVKKKGVKRQDFFTNFTKQMKTKRHTNLNSQEIRDCFKTSSLDEADFQIEFADQVLSNCSSRSGDQKIKPILDRRMSIDSQGSRKSQTFARQNQQKIDHHNIKQNVTISNSPKNNQSTWNIEMDQNNINQNSTSYITNKSSRHLAPLKNPTISEVKESQASSSIPHLSISRNFTSNSVNQDSIQNQTPKNNHQPKFDDQSIKQEVKKAFERTFKLLDSQNQELQEINQWKTESGEKFNSENRTSKQVIEQQKQSDKKLAQKLKEMSKKAKSKKMVKNQQKNESKEGIHDHLGSNINVQEKPKKKQKKKQKKSKKGQHFSLEIDSYFEQEAEYSSSQEGHTDSDQDSNNKQDIDIDGNLWDLVDQNSNVKINQRAIRKKFLEDEQKRDEQAIQRILNGLYGKKKQGQSESQKRLKQRMDQAAKRNQLQDYQLKQIQIDNPFVSKEDEPSTDQNLAPNSQQKKKLKKLQQQLLYGGRRMEDNDELSLKPQTHDTWKMIATVLPAQRSNRVTVYPRSGIKSKAVSREKSGQQKKSILDRKSSNVLQSIHNKRITLDHKRGESNGNRNKLQKAGAIQLDIRDTNLNIQEDFEI